MLTQTSINPPPNASCKAIFDLAVRDNPVGNTNIQMKWKVCVVQNGTSSSGFTATGAFFGAGAGALTTTLASWRVISS
ncbi:hypothetical protein UFOVP809_20 [uncultured Caudovirales phage]|uniref:Uncharacterized protein n=1 Tax=uncultured Caudovirales phage TaxID=2100421 RepID=A0A6J5NWK0_9CAUD|nr:hypothetical protein UFOVP809_20 [uncultured Caudovirales phage]